MIKNNAPWTSFLFLLLLGGCENKSTVNPVVQSIRTASENTAADKLDDIGRIERCRRELEALKKIDSIIYNKRKLEFDKLISGAALYSGVRKDVDDYTQNAVDALYRFRTDKLCADISSDVLSELSSYINKS
ncbi:hypothetical protein CSM97_000076 [Salmonella enterica subsp. diarizonae]|nr:hypothetical protein [Salmonella enterica subsp. diarizonae]EDX6217663.1 hypothetical protein [Salmonella enterica subsp. diarizonae]